MKRATLADFTDSSDAGTDDRLPTDGDGPTDTGCDDSARPDDRPSETASPDRPTPTFAGGRKRPCARCGAQTARGWRADEAYVCPSCVEW